jgi:para-aminobenzoate synthetase component I
MRAYLPGIISSPKIETVSSPLLPEEAFALFADMPGSALLSSSLEGDAARYSFIGLEPFFSLKSKGPFLEISLGGQKIKAQGNAFETLRSVLGSYRFTNDTPFPFISGGIGYFSYDLKNMLEDLPRMAHDDLNIPDMYFTLYRVIIVFDRMDPGKAHISALDLDGPGHRTSSELIREVKEALAGPARRPCAPAGTPPRPAGGHDIISNFTRSGYIRAVEKVLEHIRAGDIYQACLSQRFKTEWNAPGYDLYRKLNALNPAPFSAYLDAGDHAVISSSPELFIRRRGTSIETRPMKGTRPRGATPEEDAAIRRELEKSQKDISELLMIVDLERNDLGRISVPGSVKVIEERRIETYPTVFQTIGVVRGEVTDSTDNIDILKAVFPGGSITGCPKIRAMEIIDSLEPTSRGVYTGAIGYLSFHGTMDLNIAIRTMVLKGSELYFGAGGGIVSDSDPEAEYNETLVKARALIDSLS